MDKSEKNLREKEEAIDAFAKLTGCPTNIISKVDTIPDIRKAAGLPQEEFSKECYVCKRSDIKLFKCGRCKCPTELWCSTKCQKLDIKRHKHVCITCGEINIGSDSAISQSLIDKVLKRNKDEELSQDLKDELIKSIEKDMKKFLPNLKSKGE